MLWVGLGCQRGVSQVAIFSAIEWVCTQFNLDLDTIAGVATIDLKAEEVGLVDCCRELGWFLKIYSPEWLNSVRQNHLSSILTPNLSTLIGTTSVAEAAAFCAAASNILLVPKQKFRLDSQSGWVTIAIAIEQNITGDSGV